MARSGADYIRGLRDGRAVFLDGERVDDVANHPAFAAAVRSIAQLYDVANDPANRDADDLSLAARRPARQQVLAGAAHARGPRRPAAGHQALGRSPPTASSAARPITSPRSSPASPARRDFFARDGQQFADNLAALLREGGRRGPLPQLRHRAADRSTARKPAHQQPEPFLYAGAAAERDGGIVVRGAQMLATGGVMSDWVFVTVILPLRPGDEDYAISVVVPNDAPGLKLYTRRPYATRRDQRVRLPAVHALRRDGLAGRARRRVRALGARLRLQEPRAHGRAVQRDRRARAGQHPGAHPLLGQAAVPRRAGQAHQRAERRHRSPRRRWPSLATWPAASRWSRASSWAPKPPRNPTSSA